jgi:hypothetical protein
MSGFALTAVLIFALGIWIGVGAPGWPWKPEGGGRRHTQRRPINPVAWGRTPGRERQRPRSASERKIRLR